MKNLIINKLKGGLVVSCQGLPHEPMHGSMIMQKFAVSAMQGGAVGIRANTVEDISAIKEKVSAPVIGIIKKDYDDSEVYITPTLEEVKSLISVGVEIIALDGTIHARPNGEKLEDLVAYIKAQSPNTLIMADTATYEDALYSKNAGVDLIGTTLRGYTTETKGVKLPDYKFIKKLVKTLGMPIVAEGGISTPKQLAKALKSGACFAVVGGAITRPQNITKSFVSAIK